MKKMVPIFGAAIIAVLVIIPDAFATGPGFSGITALADSAETVATNPAGMMRLKKPSIYGNPLIFYSDSETEVTAKATGRKQTISNDSFMAMPGLYYAHPIGDRWAVGIGPNAATGLGATYNDDWAGRYLLKEWSLVFAGIAPAAAFRISDKLSVGAAVPIMYSRYTLEKAVFNLDREDGDGDFELDADGWGVGFNLGILYELSPHTRFGLAYRSKVSVTEEGKPDFSDLSEERAQLLEQFGLLNQEISVDTSTPQVVTAGLFHEFGSGWSVTLDLAWVDFSEWGLENVELGDTEINTKESDYKDIWAGSIGLNYRLTPDWGVRSGAFYLSSALDDEDRTAFSRFDEMWGLGLGVEHWLKKTRSLTFDLTYIQFGDGEFAVEGIPLVGDIEGEYTTNYALVFGIGTKW